MKSSYDGRFVGFLGPDLVLRCHLNSPHWIRRCNRGVPGVPGCSRRSMPGVNSRGGHFFFEIQQFFGGKFLGIFFFGGCHQSWDF